MLPPLGPSLVVDDVVEVDAASRRSRIAGVGDDVVGVDAASSGSLIAVVEDPWGNDAGVARHVGGRAPEVCAISVIRQRAETENSALADIDDTVEDAQAGVGLAVQHAARGVDTALDRAIGDALKAAGEVA